MSSKPTYYGAARFVEIAPPAISFRAFANVDHITSITFGEKREQQKFVDKTGTDGEPDETHMESVVVGFAVNIGVGGQNNEFTFRNLGVAIMFYNDLLASIQSLRVPCHTKPRMEPPPPPPSPLVDEDGNPIGSAEPVSDEELSAMIADALNDDGDDDYLPGEDPIEPEPQPN